MSVQHCTTACSTAKFQQASELSSYASKLKNCIKMSGGAGLSKKPKTYHFHMEWEEDFLFFTSSYSKCIAIPKKGNVERHFRSVHKSYDTDFLLKSEQRRRKVKELKSQLSGQQAFFSQLTTKVKTATKASFQVSHAIIKNKK